MHTGSSTRAAGTQAQQAQAEAISYGSVCAGIEAATVAWHPLGWRAAWYAEIARFPNAVLAHHYPDVANLGDMREVPRLVRARSIAAPDVLVGGTPCQSFSVAGLRQSLEDERGNLALSFVECANAIDDVRADSGKPACVIVWENVPGVLTTKDNAFGSFIASLAGLSYALDSGAGWSSAGVVLGPRRVVCWRTLDAQYFGLAQRRRRVFIVASARDGFDSVQVLLESESLRRNHPPRREASAGKAAEGIARSVASYGVPETVGALNDGAHRGGGLNGQDAYTGRIFAWSQEVADPLTENEQRTYTHEGKNFRTRNVQATRLGVRRLTPRECERLMGFPDDYTRIRPRTKDAQRYRAIGNSMAVPVMRWLGERIGDAL